MLYATHVKYLRGGWKTFYFGSFQVDDWGLERKKSLGEIALSWLTVLNVTGALSTLGPWALVWISALCILHLILTSIL